MGIKAENNKVLAVAAVNSELQSPGNTIEHVYFVCFGQNAAKGEGYEEDYSPYVAYKELGVSIVF